jgi:hypothetical protein
VAFRPDSHLLAATGTGHEVLLWDLDVASWRRLCQLAGRDLTAEFLPQRDYHSTCTTATS